MEIDGIRNLPFCLMCDCVTSGVNPCFVCISYMSVYFYIIASLLFVCFLFFFLVLASFVADYCSQGGSFGVFVLCFLLGLVFMYRFA